MFLISVRMDSITTVVVINVPDCHVDTYCFLVHAVVLYGFVYVR